MVVTHRSIDKLIDRFIENGNPYYAVITGSGVHNKNEQESDIDSAADRLRSFLKETDGSEATYCINTFKVVPKGGIKKNSEADTVLTFKQQKYSPEEKAEYRSNRSYFEEKLLERMEAMAEQQAQFQLQMLAPSEEEIEEEVQAEDRIIGTINKVMEHPVLSNLITGVISKFLTPTNTQPMQLAGTQTQVQPQTTTLEEILQTLFNKGVTIEHLYKLSQFDEAKIKMLLTML